MPLRIAPARPQHEDVMIVLTDLLFRLVDLFLYESPETALCRVQSRDSPRFADAELPESSLRHAKGSLQDCENTGNFFATALFVMAYDTCRLSTRLRR